jgi:hypothetical protein
MSCLAARLLPSAFPQPTDVDAIIIVLTSLFLRAGPLQGPGPGEQACDS